jgi:ribosomal protein S27E
VFFGGIIMIRAFFGLFFLIGAIGIPFGFFNAGYHKQIISEPFIFIELSVFEFIFIFSAIKLLQRKKVPQKQFYGGDYESDSDPATENAYRPQEIGNGYSSYNSNTVIHTNNQSFSYTEININSDKYDKEDGEKLEEKVEEAPRQVSVTCSGCGAKVKVYRKQFTDCEYCGTTVEAS